MNIASYATLIITILSFHSQFTEAIHSNLISTKSKTKFQMHNTQSGLNTTKFHLQAAQEDNRDKYPPNDSEQNKRKPLSHKNRETDLDLRARPTKSTTRLQEVIYSIHSVTPPRRTGSDGSGSAPDGLPPSRHIARAAVPHGTEVQNPRNEIEEVEMKSGKEDEGSYLQTTARPAL